ncbi:MAG: MaoC family dehydratase [Chloroflexi bacterium]|nr:MaoC family dehydratase [Chloroflexota bacterium]
MTTSEHIQPGLAVSGPSKHVTSYRTWLFSGGWPRFEGWPAKNVHTDLEFALACGLPVRGASGAMLQAYLAELIVDLFGEDWLTRGRLDLKFVRLVDIDDRIVAHGVVTSRQQDGSVELDLWCQNQRGEKVCAGTGRINRA